MTPAALIASPARGHDARAWPIRHREKVIGAKLVLLLAVDRERGVEARRAEAVARGRVGRVDVRARVDDQRLPGGAELERQLVVMCVAAMAVQPGVATTH